MWRLLFPLQYFKLRNSEKFHLDLWPTLVLAAILAAPFIAAPEAKFFASSGFLDKLLVLTSALSAFYVAALIAMATFPHPDLDKVITVGPITIKRKSQEGYMVVEHLTRREFTTTLFGYLAFSALTISVLSAAAIPLSETDVSPLAKLLFLTWAFRQELLSYWRDFCILGFSILTAHMIVATCLGFYYLMGRIYRRDPKVISAKPDKAA